MLRVNEFRFFDLGSKINAILKGLSETTTYNEFLWPGWEAREAVAALITDAVPLRVCKPAAQDLIQALVAIVPLDFREAISKQESVGGQPIGYHFYRVEASARKFETILGAECQALDTYFISQKGSHHTPDLIERAEINFPESIRQHIPRQATIDFRQAGRCLAFDTPTASGFHLLRAVEATMGMYLSHVTGKPIPPARTRNWGFVIKQLRKSGNADPKITEFLDHIRDKHRNPITHPEVILTNDEVIVLLGVAVSIICQMVLAIHPAPPTP